MKMIEDEKRVRVYRMLERIGVNDSIKKEIVIVLFDELNISIKVKSFYY